MSKIDILNSCGYIPGRPIILFLVKLQLLQGNLLRGNMGNKGKPPFGDLPSHMLNISLQTFSIFEKEWSKVTLFFLIL